MYYTVFKNMYFSFISLLAYIPALLGMAGAVIFFSTGFKKSRLLRFYMCFEITALPFTVWSYYRYFTSFNEYSISKSEFSVMLVISMFFTLLMTASCVTGLWLLSREQKIKITYIEYGNERAGQFEPAGAGLRFTNRLFDSFVILYFILINLGQNSLTASNVYRNNYLSFLVLEIPLVIVYYLLMEGIFNTTAGKCVTNTIITNENGERPHFGQILGRTFCRLIPFDALSFLAAGARGWHDSLSGTYVVSAANSEAEATEEIIFDAEKNEQHS
jgi:uncharacterized RDD family membrane protein YckC